MADPIRVGMIRCDTHGAYYAPLMDRHDPLLLRNPMPLDQPAQASWQTGGAHYYHYMNYADPRRMTADFVGGFEIVKLWDQRRELAEMLSKVLYGRPAVCDHFAQVSDDVDLVFIADCNGDGSDHLELAAPGLKKGVATFIDKPLAYTVAHLEALLDLAAQHRAPLYSMSILGALPQTLQFRSRLAEVGELQFGSIQGGGTAMAGHVHALVLALAVFGGGVQRVFSTGPNPLDLIHLDYGNQPHRPVAGVTITCNVGSVWHCAFHCTASGPMGAILSSPLNDFVFPFGAAQILRQLPDLVRTGHPPADFSLMVEAVCIAEAARTAHTAAGGVALDQNAVQQLLRPR
ncbi:MAG: Gfo/Idh/MocA family oxidoreductase [Candidatus Latescibacteria bacterium]|nr:Gfo/Idh/MocA family oxidoreductase [Candidatus Latescibacterota bacterium]